MRCCRSRSALDAAQPALAAARISDGLALIIMTLAISLEVVFLGGERGDDRVRVSILPLLLYFNGNWEDGCF